jgi:hypothetical protein
MGTDYRRRSRVDRSPVLRLLSLLLLTGCAGHEATIWRPQKPEVRDREVCVTRGADRQCRKMTSEEFRRVLEQYGL